MSMKGSNPDTNGSVPRKFTLLEVERLLEKVGSLVIFRRIDIQKASQIWIELAQFQVFRTIRSQRTYYAGEAALARC